MKSVVLCEKPSQARNVQAAVGGRYGRVIGLAGHVLKLAEPDDIKPEWKEWGYDLLRPDSGFYPLVPDSGKERLLRTVSDELKDAERVIIATDCDREGQAIGENLVRYLKFNGEVLRAMFNAEDVDSLRQAFASLKPNQDHLRLYQAAVARAQADQIANLSATRAATKALKPANMRGAVGMGRVKTPTMAIVCRRQLEISQFTPRAYWNLWLDVSHANETVRLRHAPDDKARLYDKAQAVQIIDGLKSWSGPVSVTREAKRQSPPKLPDLPTLQIQASRWGWTASKTLDVAQALYETHKITTYPRAENRYLPEVEIANAQAMLDGLKGLSVASVSYAQATTRKGKNGHFSDKALEGSSHHAIVPNVKTIDQWPGVYAALDKDEKRLFDLIARTYLAAVGPDREYDRTEIAILSGDRKFAAVGIVDRILGWREALAVVATEPAGEAPGGDEGEDGDDKADQDDGQRLPAWPDKAIAQATNCGTDEKVTTPPPYYTEGTLIKAMQEAWRFATDPATAARLKEAKGIGTPATRDSIILGLRKQGFFEESKGKLSASALALGLYDELMKACPEWLDPAVTAEMEMALDAILRGETNPRQVIDDIVRKTQKLLDAMRERAADGALDVSVKQPPSAKLLAAAKSKAKRMGVSLPRGASQDARICQEFLGPRPEGNAPSEAQIEYARKVAQQVGEELPQDVLEDRSKLSDWITANKDKASSAGGGAADSPPSEAQLGFANKIAAEKGLTIPDETLSSRMKLSRWIDANAAKSAKGKGGKGGKRKAR